MVSLGGERLLDFLLDTKRVGRRSRPEFTKGVAVAISPEGKVVGLAKLCTKEGDNAVGELADGDGVERFIVEPVDGERVDSVDALEAFERGALSGGFGRVLLEGGIVDLFADECVGEVFWPAFSDGLGLGAFGEHEVGHVAPTARPVEGLVGGGLVVDPDRLERRELVPASRAGDLEP